MKGEIFGPHSVPMYKDFAGDIHSTGVHLLNLINEILDLSRIEAGRYELNEEAVSLHSVVEDCHHLLKLRAGNRGITIHEMFEPDMPRLWADERAIRQICLNLLSNAIKFTPQGGKIWLKVGWTASGGQYMSVKEHRAGHSGRGNPDRARVVRGGLELAQIGRKGCRPRSAHCQEPHRPARWHLHAEIEAAHRHRGDRHLPTRARDVGPAADRRERAADPAASRHVVVLLADVVILRVVPIVVVLAIDEPRPARAVRHRLIRRHRLRLVFAGVGSMVPRDSFENIMPVPKRALPLPATASA